MSGGTMAGMLLNDLIQGRDNPWAALYDPGRFKPDSIPRFVKENTNVAVRLVTDRMAHPPVETPPAGHGEVVDGERGREALYREESGVLHRLSPVCTHMGCLVHWNPAEKSWDCPCHGGRFAADGQVIQGPPNKGLDPLPLPEKEVRNDA
jgi:Rieske Fe-S protein